MNYQGPIQSPVEKNPTAEELMTRNEPVLAPDMPLMEAMDVFLKHKISGAPVVDRGGRLLGMLSEKDCLKLLANKTYYHHLPAQTVEAYMTPAEQVQTVELNIDMQGLATLFLDNNFRKVPVMKNDRVIGQVSRRDVMRGIHKMLS
ncbi:MAG: CBS domain-containing protein [Leptospiraceae bacterium]|nr:CBS domain-containing protein [Leptospiraceae bacterium]